MATKTINGQIQIRNDTAQNWAVKNPILLAGELGLETDTLKGKVGDGTTTWNSLGYAWGGGAIPTIATGSANGTISVDGTDVAVKGLGTAAYKGEEDFETREGSTTKYNKLWSLGEQLIINGSGILGDNTNFSALTYDSSVANASAGSFTREGHAYALPKTDEYIPLSPNSKYELSMDLKSDGTASTIIYAFLLFYDVDKYEITAATNMYIANTLTTLSQDLKAGDTVVHFTDLTNWNVATTASHQHGFIFWNYTNSKGYTYPELTYSRNVFLNKYADNSAVDKTNNTITLSSAWTGATIPAGTKVSQSSSGGTYKYAFSTANLPGTWTNYKGYYDGVDYSGGNATTKMPPGTAYAKLGFLWNYQSKGGQIWATNISLKAVERVMVGATASVAGTAGIIPAPAAGKQNQYLRGDGKWEVANASTLLCYPSARPTTANTRYGDGRLRYYLATTSMSDGKPPSDATILHFGWDNTGGWDTQLAIGTTGNKLYYRGMNGGSAWNTWKTVATTDDLASYLPLNGGSMAGTIKWNATSLPNKTSSAYAVVIDAFASGGEMGWRQLGTAAFTASTDYAAASHNQASNTINAMTGYSKPSTTSAITASDSLNTAIGKLEKALETDVSPVSACTAGDYYAQNTVIPLTVTLSHYSKLLFVCGADSATDGIQTIIVPLHTGKTHHRLTWFSGDGKRRFDGEAHKYLVVSINETADTVTIVASGVASNGISQILAE